MAKWEGVGRQRSFRLYPVRLFPAVPMFERETRQKGEGTRGSHVPLGVSTMEHILSEHLLGKMQK
jgi:hypothetical protein